VKCIKSEEVVKPVVPELPENQTPHNNRVWDYYMGVLMKK